MSALARPVPGSPPPLQVWLRAVRIFSFTASVTPVLIGSAFALVAREFSPLLFVLIAAACVLCHAGCNLANDYFDHRKGIDSDASLGPAGVIQDGWLAAAQVRTGMIVALGAATVLGLVVLALSTWWLLGLAVPSLIVAVLYTGGPKPLGYMALGEVTVLLFMGVGIVCGTFVAMTGSLSREVSLGSLGISVLVAAILHANNLRDFDLDRAAGKKTLAHVLGRKRAIAEFIALIVLAYGFTALLIMIYPSNWPTVLVLLTVPAAAALIQLVRSNANAQSLNASVRGTAQLHFRFGLLFTLGLVIRAVVEYLD
jgi:1,4-dihydroxy-2-naphthoate polyprenyltransferase